MDEHRVASSLGVSNPYAATMTGSIALGIVVVSGADGPYRISEDEYQTVLQEVLLGTRFLVNAKPSANVSFVYEPHLVTVVPASSGNPNDPESTWRDPSLEQLGYYPGPAGAAEYGAALKVSKNTQWSYVLFVTKFPTWHFAYREGSQPVIVMSYGNDGWGTKNLHRVFAHETGHIFSAPDEYTPSCGGAYGRLDTPNNNSVSCSWARVPCLMDQNTLEVCQYTQWQFGWNNLVLTNQCLGPSGGHYGQPFEDRPLPDGARISKIRVNHGSRISAVGISYDRTVKLPRRPDKVVTVDLPLHGGTDGSQSALILGSDEYVTSIRGSFTDRVNTLQIVTNKRTSDLYGKPQGGDKPFEYTISNEGGGPANRKFAGFLGRSGSAVDALGMIVVGQDNLFSRYEALTAGPSGGSAGNPLKRLEVPPNGRLTKINIRHDSVIFAIGFTYELDGKTHDTPMLGGNGGKLESFTIDADDYVVGISGRYGQYVDSLIVQTKKNEFSKRFGGSGGDSDYTYVLRPGAEEVQLRGLILSTGAKVDAIGGVFKRIFF